MFFAKRNNLLEKLNGLDFEEEELLKFLSEASGKQVFVKEEFEDSLKVSLKEELLKIWFEEKYIKRIDVYLMDEENIWE